MSRSVQRFMSLSLMLADSIDSASFRSPRDTACSMAVFPFDTALDSAALRRRTGARRVGRERLVAKHEGEKRAEF
jgi:hypothetical protein